MNSLSQLEKEAQARRAQFSKTLLELKGRMTPSGLAQEALGLLTPQHSPLQHAVKRRSALSASLWAGAGWLLKQVLQIRGDRSSLRKSAVPRAPRANRSLSARPKTSKPPT